MVKSKFFICLILNILLVFSFPYTSFSEESSTQKADGTDYVKARIIFSKKNKKNESGSFHYRIGVLLEVSQGWHIYWKNPGEAGKPTQIIWKGPEGWSFSDINWPVPLRMIEPGDISTFAYSGKVLLFSDLFSASGIDGLSQDSHFSSEVSWLVCKDRCIPGQTTLQAVMNPESLQPNNDEIYFDEFEKRVPEKLDYNTFISKTPSTLYLDKKNSKGGINVYFKFENKPDLTEIKEAQFFESLNLESYSLPETAKKNGSLYLRTLFTEIPKGAPFEGVLALKYADNSESFFELILPRETLELLPDIGSSDLYLNDKPEFVRSTYLYDSYEMHKEVEKKVEESGYMSLAIALLSAFLGGIILNLMPCVLPILSIKVMGIISAKEKNTKENLHDSLWYLLGILLCFIVVAGVTASLKASGELLGWGFQFQYPGFVLFLILVLFVLSLGFFDLYIAELPFLNSLTRLSTRERVKSSSLKHLVDGLLISTLSTPCTAPFLGTAIIFAFSQSTIRLFLVFISIGLGLAFPYILIVSRPSLLRFFPRPGNWMNRVKQLMGFGLLGTIIWLLFVLENLKSGSTTGVLMLLLSVYMLFWFYSWSKELASKFISLFLILLGVCFPILSVWYMPPLDNKLKVSGDIEWISYSEDILKNTKGPVFLDFTADWCITCKYNEKFVLTRSGVVEVFLKNNVTALKADWTSGDEIITRALERFGGKGVPHYVYIRNPESVPEILPTILTEGSIRRVVEAR
ncbi:MAG TPA: thioredoxin family protein [Oligoflexia bacterium]|nr:thioredoxin family protein [Oligoflexia bacterium]HMP47469.1 thioredoxin family protein [Oligoflexia bacterium]